jgi:predicted lipid-binding transport protein (Tim44 family)
MSSWRLIFAMLLAAVVALAPALADARAGGGGSQGSRGSRTHESSPSGAQPMQRSTQPQAAPTQSVTRPAPGTPGAGMAQPSFFQRHPFMTGMLGGLVGAGLIGMLFGSPAWAADGSGTGSAFGLILQLLIIGGLAYLAFRIWRSRSQPAAATQGLGRTAGFGGLGGGTALGGQGFDGAAPAARPANPVELEVAPADYDAWSALLAGIQDAWSKGDLAKMRAFVTPEMLGYFSEQLSANASRGIENRIEAVELLKGDVAEAWAEGEFEYVTARLRWKALDYTVKLGTEEVVEGSRTQPEEAEEVWTFVRSRGGNWILSAIQQI